MKNPTDYVVANDQRLTRSILTDLRLHGDQTVVQLAKALGLLRGDVSRILITCEIAGAVKKVGKFYRATA
jgi:hypothetical protein